MPTHLGPYEVVEVLGRGGGGIVYRARAADGRKVAVKTLVEANELDAASLRAEVHALRRVQHPGVVQIYDDGLDDGHPWFAMEWLEGETLASYAQRTFDARAAVDDGAWTRDSLHALLTMLIAICEPLAALHESGVVHRDLKLDNIVLRDPSCPVLIDFGLATHRHAHDVRARPEPVLVDGTLGNMAPEQLSGELVDARTDLYALGCILFELLVGTPPSWCDAGALPSSLAPGIPPPLDALVLALLAPRARDRLGHAEDAITWLRALMNDHTAAPHSFLPSRRRWLYRPFLSGRRDVLAQLAVGLERMQSALGSFMILEGESGIGKTHIAAEITRRASFTSQVLTATCPPSEGSAPPLSCWDNLFEHAAQRTAANPDLPIARTVRRHLPLLVQLHASFTRIGPIEHSGSVPTAHEVHAAIQDLIAALAEEGPLLIVIDDLQWIDELSLGALRLLGGDFLRQLPVFLLATFRNDDRAGSLTDLLGDCPLAQRIAPGPLPDTDLHELVADMLGVSQPPLAVVEWVARHAEGNPFLAAEYLRLVVTEIPLTRELTQTHVRVVSPSRDTLAKLPTPGSVRELVQRRLQVLDHASLAIAELLAVLGGSLDAETLQLVAADPSARDALLTLEQQQLVERAPGGGRKLVHDRIRVGLYEQLERPRRLALHREAAALLERALEVPHARVARHLDLAGDLAAALPHLEQGGEQALARAAHEAAARLFERARSTAARLARSGTTFPVERRVRWELGSARAEYGRGHMIVCEEHVREALRLTGRALPNRPLSWIGLAMREGARGGLRALGPAARPGDAALRAQLARATSLLPYRYFYAGDLLPVIGSSLLSANLARHGSRGVAAGPISLLAFTADLFRLSAVADRFFGEAASSALAKSDYHEAAQVLSLESMSHGNFARWPQAKRAARAAAAAGSHTSDPWLLETIETSLSHVEFFTGQFEAAEAHALTLTRVATARQHPQHAIWGLYLQARSDLPRRRWTAASERLEEALRLLEERPETISEIACHGMLAHALFESAQLERAEQHAMWVVEKVRALAPPGYPSIVGYAGAGHVVRGLLELEDTPWRRSAARNLAASLWQFTAAFPVAYPTACLHTGHLARRAGLGRAAHVTFTRAARWAHDRSMPWERAQLLLAASHTARTPEEARTLRTEAHRTCEELGVPTP